MINLLDNNVIETLKEMFGTKFTELDEDKRVILVTTYLEKVINHNRANEIIAKHPHDVSQLLKQLVEDNFLDSSGQSRGKVYFLPNTHFESPDEFSAISPDINSITPDISSITPDISSITPDITNPLSQFSQQKLNQLREIAAPISQYQRVEPVITKKVILDLCSLETLSLPILAELLNRSEDSLRKNFLNPMVTKEHTLERAYPQTPNHPKQAYKTVKADL